MIVPVLVFLGFSIAVTNTCENQRGKIPFGSWFRRVQSTVIWSVLRWNITGEGAKSLSS